MRCNVMKFQLRKVDAPPTGPAKKRTESNEMAAILMRRVAMEMSDTEDGMLVD